MKKNTMDYADYIQTYIFAGQMSLLGYYHTVFIGLPKCSAAHSLLLLEVALAGGLVCDLLPVFRIARNWWSILGTMCVILGGYTGVTYYRHAPEACRILLAAACGILGIYLLLLFVRKIDGNLEREKVFRIRVRRGVRGAGVVAAVTGLLFILSGAAVKHIPQTANVLYRTTYTAEDALEANIGELLKLQPETYAELNTDEKLELLQIVANIEGRYLGLDERVFVGCADLNENTLGYYRDSSKEILIDTDYLEAEPREVVRVLCHEMYHAAQHQYARIYDKLSPDEKRSYFLTEAAAYAEELKDYKDGEEGGYYEYVEYYSQSLEREARAYGLVSSEQIFERIEEECGDVAKAVEPVRLEADTSTAQPVRKVSYRGGDMIQIINYAYDGEFVYEDTTYVQEANGEKKEIRDADGNVLLSQEAFSGGILTDTYTYEYRENTERKQIQYCYAGEGKEFARLTVILYNKYGEEAYRLVQSEDGRSYEYRTGYTYDDSGRLVTKRMTCAINGEAEYRTRESLYSYDENDRRETQIVKETLGSEQVCISEVQIRYEYDAQGREIRSEQTNLLEDEPAWICETSYQL